MANRFAICLCLFLSTLPFSVKAASSYSSLYVFGDSLSDTGNLYTQTAGTTPASPPYFNGRFSNGIVFPEYLQPLMGLSVNNATNFAYGGARTGTASPNDILSRVNLFATSNRLPSNSLTVVFGGANDYFANAGGVANQAMVNTTVNNLLTSVTTLTRVGGTAFLVPNLPNLGATPYAVGVGQTAALNDATIRNNTTLLSALSSFQQQNPGITVISPDNFALFNSIRANPSLYDISNTTIPCIDSLGAATGACATPQAAAQTLFFDPIHPTTTGANIMAQFYNGNIVTAINGPRTIAVQPNLAQISSETIFRQERAHFDALQEGNKEELYTFKNRNATVYMRGNFSMGSRDEQSSQSGFLYHNTTGLLGFDYDHHRGLILGTNAGYGETTAKLENGAGSVDLNVYSVNVYGLYNRGGFYNDTVAGYDYLDFNDIKRATGFSFGPETFADTSGRNLRVGSEIGYKFPIAQNFKAGPLAGIRYTNTAIDNYTENGSSLFNLNVSSQKSNSVIGELGFNASGKMIVSGIAMQPHARAALEHEYQDNTRNATIQLTNNLPYSISNDTNNRNAIRLSGGVEATLTERTSIDLNYETAIINNGYDHALFGNFKYQF